MIFSFKQLTQPRIRFIISFLKFKYFLTKLKTSLVGREKQKVDNNYIIVLSPWLMTSTPWFSITTGILLYKKGNHVQFLVDDLPFEDNIDRKIQIFLINNVLISLKKLGLKVERLSNMNSSKLINTHELDLVNKLAFANAIHKNRGEEESEMFTALCSRNFELLKNNFPFVKSHIQKNDSSIYIFPGGIYGNSGLFETVLKMSDKCYFTFDSGFEVLLSTYKGVAAQFTDIPLSLSLLSSGDEKDILIAKKFAQEEFEKRKNGTNKLNSQYQSFKDSETFDNVGILIPLNSPWDSAALNISSLFSGYNEWLLATVGLLLDNSEFNITIRQHPDERFWWGKTKTDFNQLIKDKYDSKRIQFVSCYDKVNSYALLNKSEAVICYSSTFGIEAAMANKVVCVCSNVYYSNLGFSFKPSNIEDIKYFLKNIKTGKIQIDKDKAFLTYYLGQQCNWLFTPFTPMVTDLDKWLSMGIARLLDDSNVSIYLESLEKLLPMSYLNHKRNYDKN